MGHLGRRALTAIVLMVLMTAAAGAALAQSEDEVEQARQEAFAAAEARNGAAADTRSAVVALATAVHRYESLTAELTDITFLLVAAEERIRSRERAVADRRAEARRLTRQAYIAGADTILQTPGAAVGLADVAFASEVRAMLAAVRAGAVDEFDGAATELEAHRVDLDTLRTLRARVRDDAAALLPQLEDMLDAARLAEAFAVDAERAARERYQLAAGELEAALARVSPAALRWRELVERYFPDTATWAALQVLDCESRGNPEAVHDGSQATGLFQFLEGTWLFASVGAGFEGAERTDPIANVAAAAWLVARSEALAHPRGAWGHWECQPLGP
ncbi:MAG: transglycosylase SLT domain-containing protein [Acidimicrobiia bacterium]